MWETLRGFSEQVSQWGQFLLKKVVGEDLFLLSSNLNHEVRERNREHGAAVFKRDPLRIFNNIVIIDPSYGNQSLLA